MKNFECVMSIGIRCFTEIFLKQLNLKKFSGPFDAMYSSSILNVIDILKNGLDRKDLIYSNQIKNCEQINNLHKRHGYRTINKKYDYFYKDDLILTWHKAFLPHHDLSEDKNWEHFERCFKRLEVIKTKKIKVLFCLFFHPMYNNDGEIKFKDIQLMNSYLKENYNCHLLVCKFLKIDKSFVWKKVIQNEDLSYIHINNSSICFKDVEIILKEIFSDLNVNESNLIKYENLNSKL